MEEKVTYVDAWTILGEEDDVIFAVTRGWCMADWTLYVFPIIASTTEPVVLRWTRCVCLGRKTALVHSPAPGDAPQSIYSSPLRGRQFE